MRLAESRTFSGLASLLTLTGIGVAGPAFSANKAEKCDGIIEAGKNDCRSSISASVARSSVNGLPVASIDPL